MNSNNTIRTQVLLLGVFHFKDSGLDGYKPQHDIDILSPRRQEEVADVVERLARFKPTKIGIERRLHEQARTDQQFQSYLQGEFELPAPEHFQLGYRLAGRLNHPTVYCVDAWDRYYEPPVDLEAIGGTRSNPEMNRYLVDELDFNPFGDLEKYADSHGQEDILPRWLEALQEGGKAGDEAKMHRTLRETLLLMNREERLLQSHGTYFDGPFRIGLGNEYPGVDYTVAWYTRNLRIFANIQRITESMNERILVIFGSGHIPIIRHCVSAAHDYELIEVSDYLG